MAKRLQLTASAEEFLAENHLCTLTTIRPDGTPHVAPVRFTWDRSAGLVRVMTVGTRQKARNVLADVAGRASACQLAGPRWITLEGTATVTSDPARVVEGMRRYAERYGALPPRMPDLAVLEISVERVMGLY